MIEWWLPLLVLALTACGMVVIATAVPPDMVRYHLIRQVAAACMGLVAIIILPFIDYEDYRGLAPYLYWLSIALLLGVFLFGKEVNGNKNWLNLGVIQVQPSELVKVVMIVTLAKRLDAMDRLTSWFDLALPVLHVLPIVALVLAGKDLGTAFVFAVIAVVMSYAAGFPGKKILAAGLPLILLVVGLVYSHFTWGIEFPLSEPQWSRIETFLWPERNIADGGWQVFQSKVAIGSGGLQGKGLGESAQAQLGWLPFPHTDFIFAVLGEQFGFVGGVAVIAAFGLVFYRIATVAYTARDRYGALIAMGVAAMLGAHVLENIGMTMGVTPVTGIPLPFISYGPTALLANLAAIGLVLAVAVRRDPVPFDH